MRYDKNKGKHSYIYPKTKYKAKRKTMRINYILLILVCLIALFIANITNMLAYFTDKDVLSNEFTFSKKFTVIYNANDGTNRTHTQTLSSGDKTATLRKNTFIRDNYAFVGWNTMPDGTGNRYGDEENLEIIKQEINDPIYLYAQWTTGVAMIGDTVYNSLQEAINAVPTDNTQTTIKLLEDVSENLKVEANKNIVFDLQNYIVSNYGNNPTIENNGTIKIINGTLTASRLHAVINNMENATTVVTGGRIIATGERQAIYNNKGTVEISGDAYLSNTSSSATRATVHNLADSTLTITGGTIIATSQPGVNNAGTMTIGTKDGDINKNSLTIQSKTDGIISTTGYGFYDGIVKGKSSAIKDENKVVDVEDGYYIAHKDEVIDGETYKTAYLSVTKNVTFNANGGTPAVTTVGIEIGEKISNIPTPTRSGYIFEGWFTAIDGGDPLPTDLTVTEDVTYYAHWREDVVAKIGDTSYKTLAAAVSAVPTTGEETTIKLYKDVSENITIAKGKNVILDLQGNTLSNKTNNRVIINNGTLKVINGTITSSAGYAAIDNNPNAKIIIGEGTIIIATGVRQTLYNNKGTMEIMGNTYLRSSAPERATVQNLASSTLIIHGGTIISTTQQALDNAGTVTIGDKDGNISITTPSLQGETSGIKNTNKLYFYDGIVKGQTNAIEGNITGIEENSIWFDFDDTIDDIVYKTKYLVLDE